MYIGNIFVGANLIPIEAKHYHIIELYVKCVLNLCIKETKWKSIIHMSTSGYNIFNIRFNCRVCIRAPSWFSG